MIRSNRQSKSSSNSNSDLSHNQYNEKENIKFMDVSLRRIQVKILKDFSLINPVAVIDAIQQGLE
jgi:hypothetical protein